MANGQFQSDVSTSSRYFLIGSAILPLLTFQAFALLGGVAPDQVSTAADDGQLHKLRLLILRLLPEPDQQWRVIICGFCINAVLALLLSRLPSFAAGSTAHLECSPQRRRTNSEASDRTPPRSPPRVIEIDSPSSFGPIANSYEWGDWCCMRNSEPTDIFGRRPSSMDSDCTDPPWLQSREFLHPKFCGGRLREPGTIPNLKMFPSEQLGDKVPSHWEFLLPCTDEERAQCRELRSRLASVAGPKDPITMLRFLRARQHRLDAAVEMYSSAMKYRLGCGFERGFRENSLDDRLHRLVDSVWPPTGLLGQDLEGDLIYWNRLGLGNTDFMAQAPTDFLVEHEVYTITRIMQALDEHSKQICRPAMYLTVVVDLADLSSRQMNLKALSKYKVVVRVMEDNFPELVKRIVVVRAPRLASTMWNLASHFFDEGTRAKIQILDDSRTFEGLSRFIDSKWIPQALGGQHRIGSSNWCDPVIPAPTGPFPTDIMQDLQRSFPES